MKVSVLQDQFADALAIVAKAADPRAVLPVLSNILLRTSDSWLELVTTDLATAITVKVGAKIDRPGAITLPAKTLTELVKNLPEERVDLTLDDATQTVSFKCGASKGSIKGIIASEFPPTPEPLSWDTTLDAKLLARMITSVAFVAAKEDNRPILRGIYTNLEAGCLTMACADGYRLAVASRPVDNAWQLLEPKVPWAHTLLDFAKLLKDGEVQVAFDNERMYLNYGMVTYTILLLEGKFPAFQALIPTQHATQVTVYTQDLLKACKRAEIFARDSNYSTRFHVTPAVSAQEPATLTAIGKSAERGDLEGVLDASVDGTGLEVAFNVKYMIDVLNNIDAERVVLETNGAGHPCLIYPEGDDGLKFIIMPMNINR